MKIFIDTSAFIRHFYGIEDAIKLLDFAVNENEAVISQNVIEETFFKLLYLETERIFGKTGKYVVKEKFRKHTKEYKKVRKYMREFVMSSIRNGIIGLVEINEEIIRDSVEMAFDYTLLPNDALIAAVCKYHGIMKIITFDSDFKSVEFIEIID